jgi:hypothetical protein
VIGDRHDIEQGDSAVHSRFSGGAGDAVPGAGGVVTLPDRYGASDRILGGVLVERAR